MPATAAETVLGLTVQLHDGATPGTYASVAEVTGIGGVGFSIKTADATHLQSPGGWEEVKATLKTLKDVKVDCNFLKGDPTQDGLTGLIYVAKNILNRKYKILHPNGATVLWNFYAYVTDVSVEGAKDGIFTGSFTLKPTGEPITTP
jgi:predicted secreted protein